MYSVIARQTMRDHEIDGEVRSALSLVDTVKLALTISGENVTIEVPKDDFDQHIVAELYNVTHRT